MKHSSQTSSTILERIVATKLVEIDADRHRVSQSELEESCLQASPPRGFRAALQSTTEVSLIAEIKKASPSRGIIRADFDPVTIALEYEAHGATCLSVLTDESYFQGHLDFLRDVRRAVRLPVLRKDFIVDPYQVYQARASGADAVLLIAECLDDRQLVDLRVLIEQLGMDALVEFYEMANLARVVASGATLIGVNNRDLKTFKTDLNHALQLRRQLPEDVTFVAESGISDRADVLRLQRNSVDAMLVGESLMAAADIGEQVDCLLGRSEDMK